MPALRTVLISMVLLFPISEVLLALKTRAGRTGAAIQDQGSMRLLWITNFCAVGLAAALSGYPGTRLPLAFTPRAILAIALLAGGLGVRWWAILTLGRFFTVNVAVFSDHRVVQAGPYRVVRHPSYAGMLVAFLGLGVYFGNWLSVLAIMLPITLATMHRITVEEAALTRKLGAAYEAYRSRTKRLVPELY